jgi:hypothetical protein
MDWNGEVEKVAYELFERDGRQHGKDKEHWMEAEKIVRARHASGERKAEAPKKEEAPKPNKAASPKASPGKGRQAAAKSAPMPAGGRAKKGAN